MQKQYRLGIPSFITVETEDGSWIREKDAQKTEKDDVVVTYETTPEAEEVWLTADQTKVKTIKFRWNTPVNKKSRILGGSWERTYGDVDWKGVSGSRFMPWYFLAAVGETVTGYGVKVRRFRHVFLAGRYPWNYTGDGCALWRYRCAAFR